MSTIKRVSPHEAKELLAQGYVHVDVRSEPEFLEAHAEGALNVPFMHQGPGGMSPNPDFVAVMQRAFGKDAKLVVACRSGVRSLKAATALVAAGFGDVVDQRAGFDGPRDSFGGYAEKGWAPSGLPVERGATPGATYADVQKRPPALRAHARVTHVRRRADTAPRSAAR